MRKYKYKYCIKISFFLVIILFSSCYKKERNESSIQLIYKFKKLSKNKVSILNFGSDTLYFPLKQILSGNAYIFGKNKSAIRLQIATVLASHNCNFVTYNKKNVEPQDSLRIKLMISDSTKAGLSALTVIGNLPNGYQTIFIKCK